MQFMDSAFDLIWQASLRAAAFVVLVLFVQAVLHRHLSARMRYGLWAVVLAVLLVPILPESRFSIEQLWKQPQVASSEIVLSPPVPPASPVVLRISRVPIVNLSEIPTPSLLAMAWVAGAGLVLLVGSASTLLTLRRIRHDSQPASPELISQMARLSQHLGLRQAPRLLISDQVTSPAVTGLWKPTLLLPRNFPAPFSEQQAELILLHELTHLRRKDLPINALSCLLLAVHWFNPVLWLAFALARRDREAACDEQVLEGRATDVRHDYGHALIEAAAVYAPRGLSLGFVGILQKGHSLRSRIRDIATPPQGNRYSFALVLLMLGLSLVVGATHAQTQTSAPTQAAKGSLQNVAEDIIIPAVQFSDTTLKDAVAFFHSATRNPKVNPTGRAIQITYPESSSAKLTLDLISVPLSQALYYVAELSELKVHYKGDVIALEPMSSQEIVNSRQPVPTKTPNSQLWASAIRIPEVQFKEATMAEVSQFFVAKTQQADPGGANLHVLFLKDEANPPTRISLNLKNATLWDALQHTAKAAKWRIDASAKAIYVMPDVTPKK